MKSILLSLISTNGGWLARQGLKFIATSSTAVTTYLLTLGVPENHALALVAGLVALVSAAFEFGLSKLASKIAVPCLFLGCLMLPSCGTTATGEKTFIGITGAGWLNVGKAAAVSAVPTALEEREKTAAKQPRNVQP